MKQLETEIQKVHAAKKEKELRLEENKRLDKTITNKIREATYPADVEAAKKDKAHLQAEYTSLTNDIRSDLAALEQLKRALKDHKEQDLELAGKAEDFTDQELTLLDLQRLSIHTSRISKQHLIQKRRSSEYGDRTSFYETSHKPTEGSQDTGSRLKVGESFPNKSSGSPITDASKGARSKLHYTQSYGAKEDAYEQDDANDSDDNDPRTTNNTNDDADTLARFAKMMGDNLVAHRKIHERPPKWNGPRIKVYSGRPKHNIEDFEEDIRSSCASLNIFIDREKIRHMRGFLDGDAADFVSTLSRSGNYTLDEVFTALKERFRDNRSQTDFLYMFTMRRQDPTNETIREYSHDLYTLVSKAYPNMGDAQRMEVLEQKFLSSIKVEDFEKTAMSHDLTSATYSQLVNIRARVEEFRRTKDKCQQKINDDW